MYYNIIIGRNFFNIFLYLFVFNNHLWQLLFSVKSALKRLSPLGERNYFLVRILAARLQDSIKILGRELC